MNSQTDPYFIVQDEIVTSLSKAKTHYITWTSENVKEDSDSSKLLRQMIRNIEWDLEDLQETVAIVERNPGRFNLLAEEVVARRNFVQGVRAVVKLVKSQLQSNSVDSVISFDVAVAKQPVSHDVPSDILNGCVQTVYSMIFSVRIFSL
ncbi:unnamed protein product [Protopolystoma xenopodis]|uniref:Syntaxin 6/10/61 N-terminal domain-containing protein n=1 Tax=Protopolystoma xenopodis TaxID=117903 RepID=A0A448X7B1_9PLAT|nr:unnamed protein product [Protopolystoma xenopodis]